MVTLPTPATNLTWGEPGQLYLRKGGADVPVGGDAYGPWNPETSASSTVTYDSGPGTVDLSLSTSGAYTAWSRAVLDDGIIGADGQLVGSVVLDGSEEKFASIHFRGDANWGGTNDQMVNGWRILWTMGATQGWSLMKRVAGVETTLFGPVAVTTNATTQNYKIRLSGSDIRVKVWTGSEPAQWSATVVDSALATQDRVAVSLNGGAGTEAGRNVTFSAISYTGTPPAIPFQFAQRLTEAVNTNASGPPNTMSVTLPAAVGDKPMPGDLIVVRCARDNIASDPATGDSISATPGGETYTRVAVPQNAGTAAGGIVVVTFIGLVVTAWPQGVNTVTWTAPTGAADRAMFVEHFRHAGAQRGTADTAAGSTTSAISILTADPVAGDLVIGTGGYELNNASAITPDSDTTLGSWSTMAGPFESASGGTAATRVKVWGQHKFVTGTGNQTWNPTSATAGDGAGSLITVQPGA